MAARRYNLQSLRILKEAIDDSGYPLLLPKSDLRMLLAFLERFHDLGWFPPLEVEKRRVLAAHDVIMHVVRYDLCFYEFTSKGARGERVPWLSIFFHVDSNSRVRICGIESWQRVQRLRHAVLERIRMRVERLDTWISRHKEL